MEYISIFGTAIWFSDYIWAAGYNIFTIIHANNIILLSTEHYRTSTEN